MIMVVKCTPRKNEILGVKSWLVMVDTRQNGSGKTFASCGVSF